MGMTPNEFLEAFVEPNLWDCHERPGDIRRAFNAAVSASHVVDHLFEYCRRHAPDRVAEFKDIGALVEHLSNLSDGAFRDVRSISNVYKHLYTDARGKSGVHSSVNSSGSIDTIEIEDDSDVSKLEEDYCAAANPDEDKVRVVFTRKDGSRSEFLPVLEKAIECLRHVVYDRA